MDISPIVLEHISTLANCLPEDLEPGTLLHETLGLDSLDYVELTMLIEEDADAVIGWAEIPSDITVGGFVAMCQAEYDAYIEAHPGI